MIRTTSKTLRRSRRLTAMALMLAFAAIAPAFAGPQGQEECFGSDPGGGHGGGNPELCAQGPAGCVGIGLYIKVEPNAVLPFGATVQLARSQANAWAYGGAQGWAAGYGHGDAHTAQADVPTTLGAGAIESSCDAYADPWTRTAWGTAEAARLSLSLATYGVPVTLTADVLRETGSSFNGAGGNSANIAGIGGSAFFVTIPTISAVAPPNTVVPLGPVGTLYLNEQTVAFGFCPTFNGNAARLVITDPTTGLTAATIIVSWVSTSTC